MSLGNWIHGRLVQYGSILRRHIGSDGFNNSGGSFAAGNLLIASGWDDTTKRWRFIKAQMPGSPPTHVATNAVANGESFTAREAARVTGLNTSGRAIGDLVYADTVSGGYTYTAPTTDIYPVGRVRKVDATDGEIEFDFHLVKIPTALNGLLSSAMAAVLATLTFTAPSELTIAAGAVAVTQSNHRIDTEADAATDDLTTLTGGVSQRFVLLRPENAARNVVLKHAIGANLIACPGGLVITLAAITDYALLFYTGTQWLVLAANTLADGFLAASVTWTGLPTFAHASGIKTDAVTERTATAGVTVDGTNIKDGGATLADATTFVVDSVDPTKKMAFEVAGVATGTTRTVTVPDANTELGRLRAANIFVSAEETGTGAPQNIAHGFGSAPIAAFFTLSELPAGLAAGADIAPGAHDGTNLVVTVTTGVKFFAVAFK